jgi:hypothetical protein
MVDASWAGRAASAILSEGSKPPEEAEKGNIMKIMVATDGSRGSAAALILPRVMACEDTAASSSC